MTELFIKGGWVMWPILAASIAALAVVVDRISALLAARQDVDRLLRETLDLVDKGQIEEARVRTAKARGPAAEVLSAGLSAWDLPTTEVDRRLERAAADALESLEDRMPMLATMIAVLPMLGFLGTIWGLIAAFMVWADLGDKIDLKLLSGGIYQAMITTAAGLVTSIPYVVAHNAIASRIARHAREMNTVGSELVGRHRLQDQVGPRVVTTIREGR